MSFTNANKQTFLNMTDAQRSSLKQICQGFNPSTFQIGESLRKLGLVTRGTDYKVKRVFADYEGEHVQYETKTPIKHHDWNSTALGEQIEELRKRFMEL